MRKGDPKTRVRKFQRVNPLKLATLAMHSVLLSAGFRCRSALLASAVLGCLLVGVCFSEHHYSPPLQVFGFHEHGFLVVSKPAARKSPNVCREEPPDLRVGWDLEDFNDRRYQASSCAARRLIGLAMGGVLLVAPAGRSEFARGVAPQRPSIPSW